MGQYYSYINIKTNDENKIKNITDKYEICLPVCELCVRENELEDIVKELFAADSSITVISSTSNINVDPYAYVCIIRDGKFESHYIDELYDEEDFENIAYGGLIDNISKWLKLVDSLLGESDGAYEDDEDDEEDDDGEVDFEEMRKQRVAIFHLFVEQTNEMEREKFVSYIFENWGIDEGAPFETSEEEEITKEEAITQKESFTKLIDSDYCESVYGPGEENEYIEDLKKFDLKSWDDMF